MRKIPFIPLLIVLLLTASCKRPYEPPAIKNPNRYLVVDGVINTLPDSKTTILLSRTRNLDDSFSTRPEPGASVQIEGKSGATFNLPDQGDGSYTAAHLSLDPRDLYRLRIHSSDGREYLSDFVQTKNTPPLDSVTWEQNGDVTIYAYTHDPSNEARYYRWDFTETWQYEAPLFSAYGLGVLNGEIYFRDATNQFYYCWHSFNSTDVILGTSTRLSQDVISHQPIITIEKNSPRIDSKYSILVRQYALTQQAYAYWDLVRKNSQSQGTLFDPQPGQLQSNLHNVSDPSEPVIGYVSACNVQEMRLFIANSQLNGPWQSPPRFACDGLAISQDPVDPFRWTYPDTTYIPWYFLSPSGIMIAKKYCVDCREQGGTNQKPSFWQ